MAPLSAGNARLKEIRKVSRRSVRTERRLFLADGPKAVEEALAAVTAGALEGGPALLLGVHCPLDACHVF